MKVQYIGFGFLFVSALAFFVLQSKSKTDSNKAYQLRPSGIPISTSIPLYRDGKFHRFADRTVYVTEDVPRHVSEEQLSDALSQLMCTKGWTIDQYLYRGTYGSFLVGIDEETTTFKETVTFNELTPYL